MLDAETRRAIATSRLARFGSGNEPAGQAQVHVPARRASIATVASTASTASLPEYSNKQSGFRAASPASTASLPGSPKPPVLINDDDDLEVQEAIALSKIEHQESVATAHRISPPALASHRGKRKAEDDIQSVVGKHSKVTKSGATITWPNGALRITRTPGRRHAKNCVNLEDVIQGDDLVSAYCFSFYIGGQELYRHLPLSHESAGVPVYIGRDANMDPGVHEAAQHDGINIGSKISNKQLKELLPRLQELYKRNYGKNYHAFYAWSSGSSHSKIMFLVYKDFARLVITSCNLMDIDTIGGDNHWYIHDLPRKPQRGIPGAFETDFLIHLRALSTPEKFIDSIQGWYDYSEVKVYLVTSQSGVSSGAKAEKHGLLRLRRIIQDLDLGLTERDANGKLQIDVCAASIGNLSANWLTGFHDCVLGKDAVHANSQTVPAIRLFYPSVNDVRKSAPDAQQAASNIGCHTRPWNDAPRAIQDMFHHYESKDRGRLFHQKLIVAYNPQEPQGQPYFVYVGSANLSQSAWGAIEIDKKGNEATDDKKLVKMSNFECGVVIPGHLIKDLLEDNVGEWQDAIIPFVLDGEKYDLRHERPWNDPRWVQGYEG